jgi:3-hydroxy-9,10-secoandrosta-1,3,5(10)-triene-9,17-dione monooxygenase reductase component
MAQPSGESIDATIGKAIGRIPSGVYILTTVHQGRPEVMMASWVQQAGFEPLSVSVAVHKERPIRQTLLAARHFALAVLPQDDTSLMKKYARGVPPGQEPFEGIEVLNTPGGLPVPAGALAWLECELIQACDFGGDHELHVARVTAGQVLREGKSFTHLRGSGMHY